MNYFDTSNITTDSPHHKSTSPTDDLFPALIQCFGVIVCGYFAGRYNIITTQQAKGIGTYVTQFALPALFFRVMVTIDFSNVRWGFVWAVSLGKCIMHFTVLLLSLLLSRPVNFSLSGILSTFVTQSNDVALGFPILNALYPDYAGYIYLFAPVQLVFLNTISFMLMELQAIREANEKKKILPMDINGELPSEQPNLLKQFLLVMRNVFFNPLVFMTIVGVIFNFILNHTMPKLVDKLLAVFADSFAGAALFYLGLGMVGKMGQLTRKGIYILVFILLAKQVLLPFITRELVHAFAPGNDDNETQILTTIGFLYGGLPTAPPVYLFAVQFQIMPEVIGAGLVLGTFLSAPLMFISARLVALNVISASAFDSLLSSTAFNISLLSVFSVIWVFGVFILSRKFMRVPHQITCFLLLSFLFTCIGAIAGRVLRDVDHDKKGLHEVAQWKHYVQFVIFFVGVTACRLWTAILALTLVILKWRNLCYFLRWRFAIYTVGITGPFFITGILLVSSKRQTVYDIDPIFQYGTNQLIMSFCVIMVSLLFTITMLIIYARIHKQDDQTQYTEVTDGEVGSGDGGGGHVNAALESDETSPDDSDLNYGSTSNPHQSINRSNQIIKRTNSNGNGNGMIERCGSSITSALPDIEEWYEQHECSSSQCSLEQRRKCATLLSKYRHTQRIIGADATTEVDLTTESANSLLVYKSTDEYQIHRHLILIILLVLSMFFGVFLCLWRLIRETVSGIYVELEFLDSVFNFGQGFIAFCMFGFDTNLIIMPFRRKLRKWLFDAEEVYLPTEAHLDPEVRRTRSTFVRNHLRQCQLDIVRDQSYYFSSYRQVFTATEMIDWLLANGIIRTRMEGVLYGQQLLMGRVLHHVTNEHHFTEASVYFYRFHDKYQPSTTSDDDNDTPLLETPMSLTGRS